jgi:hypothetical protein
VVGAPIGSGTFDLRFPDERSARAAAVDVRAGGFVITLVAQAGGWLISGRRRQPFPLDERERYANRLRVIAATHGGAYDGFVGD